jgi:polyhydroxybutyrate depolymerase
VALTAGDAPTHRTRYRASLFVVVALVIVIGMSACGGSKGSKTPLASTATSLAINGGDLAPLQGSSPTVAPQSTAVASTPAPARAAPPCAQARPHAAGNSDVTLDSGRHYILRVPPAYDGAHELPLVINLHGAGSNGAQQAFYSGFLKKADNEGFITLTPDATGAGHAWNFLALPSVDDDVAFIATALDRTEADLCVNAARVYSTGISSGAAMSVRLACSLQDRIAAVGVVAGIWYPPNCPPKPMPVLEFHGTEDPAVPFNGGNVAGTRIPAPSVEGAMAQWAKADGCSDAPAQARFSPHVRTEIYGGCRGNASVELYVVEGGGHTWPGSSVQVLALGDTTQEISATDTIWRFFANH